jgi:hypothetical protein
VGVLAKSSNSTSDLVRVVGTREDVAEGFERFGVEEGEELDAIGRLGATLASGPLEGSARESMVGFRDGGWDGTYTQADQVRCAMYMTTVTIYSTPGRMPAEIAIGFHLFETSQ